MQDSATRSRLIVSSIMLLLVLVSLILLDIHAKSFWIYSQIMACLYALLSVGLFYVLNKKNPDHYPTTIWHQLLHWLGLLGILYLLNLFVRTGLLSAPQAGIVTITVLALSCFLAGVYTDTCFILIGITLAVLAATAILFSSHLSLLMIPIILVVAAITYIIVRRDSNK